MEYCGIDVHQKYSEICTLAEDGEVMERTKVQTTRRALERFFSKKETMKIVLEAGGSSPWVSRLIEECGHETVVCSPRQSACQMEAPILRRLPFVHLAISRPSRVRVEARREDIKQEHTPKGGDF